MKFSSVPTTCSRCQAEAHYDFGAGKLLCAVCVTIVLSKCRVSPSDASEGKAMAGVTPQPAPDTPAIADNFQWPPELGAPTVDCVESVFEHGGASLATFANADGDDEGKRSNEDRGGNDSNFQHLRNSELQTA